MSLPEAEQCLCSQCDVWVFMAGHLGADADKWGSPTLGIPVLWPLGKPERKRG